MFDVDEDGVAALALDFGDDGETEGRLTGGLRAEDLDDTAAGEAADAQGKVDGDRASGDGRDLHLGRVSHAHQGAIAILLVDGGESQIEGLLLGCLVGRFFLSGGFGFGGHSVGYA